MQIGRRNAPLRSIMRRLAGVRDDRGRLCHCPLCCLTYHVASPPKIIDDQSMAGYSPTPLNKKLGIKPDFRVGLKNAPADYARLIAPLPSGASLSTRFRNGIDLFHLFTKSRHELEQQLPVLMQRIHQDGMIWVSWPKKAAKVPTDVTEDVIRDVALPLGLVDVKVCAVDDVWSGLKLVIRKELRV